MIEILEGRVLLSADSLDKDEKNQDAVWVNSVLELVNSEFGKVIVCLPVIITGFKAFCGVQENPQSYAKLLTPAFLMASLNLGKKASDWIADLSLSVMGFDQGKRLACNDLNPGSISKVEYKKGKPIFIAKPPCEIDGSWIDATKMVGNFVIGAIGIEASRFYFSLGEATYLWGYGLALGAAPLFLADGMTYANNLLGELREQMGSPDKISLFQKESS